MACATSFKMIQPLAMANGMQVQAHSETVNCGSIDWATVNENVAMHLFTTMPVEKLLEGTIEVPFLVQAFQVIGTDLALCTTEKLLTELLDQCYERVKTQVLGFLQSGVVPVSLSLEVIASREEDARLHCMATLASSAMYPLYLDSVQVQNDGTLAEVIKEHVVQVVESMSCPVAGCVLPLTVQSQATRELLQRHLPAMYFHGCMQEALQSLLRHLFTVPLAEECVKVPFVQDLQQFALECHDLVYFLPHQEPLSWDHTQQSTVDMVHVSPRRRYKLLKGVSAILQAEAFLALDFDNFHGTKRHGHNAIDVPCSTQILEIVQSLDFVKKVRKYVALLRPIHILLSRINEASTSTPLLVSEVYGAFVSLVQQVDANPLLSDEEKTAVQALVRQEEKRVVGSAHLLASLLDPVLLADELPLDVKSTVEQELFASLRGDGTEYSEREKQTLVVEYLDFKKSAGVQKTHKADTLAFRALKERTKTPLQFWFADGSKWPVLQAIACRLFVMPVRAARSAQEGTDAQVASSALSHESQQKRLEKVRFVRVNARQLQLAQTAGSSLAALVKSPLVEASAQEITASMVV